MTRLLCAGLLGAALAAQTPAVLENTGKPIRLPFECTVDDIHSLGLICPAEQPCPVYLELAGMDSVGGRIVAAGNLHAENTTLFSVLLMSPDGGTTWREPFERIRGAGLELVQFLDFDHGWVSGQALGAVPRDAFLLLTRDGGKTWNQRPVFGESRPGTIDFFRFDSPAHGTLWIDREQSGSSDGRYEIYESTSGGETWSLREATAKPPRQGARLTTPADWRLRADRQTKAYRVERRGGAGWEAVASFLVHVGDCREPEAALPEPAAPSEPEPKP
jgi:hypothetical protein